MPNHNMPAAVVADVAPGTKPSNYPEPFASLTADRETRQLGHVHRLQGGRGRRPPP